MFEVIKSDSIDPAAVAIGAGVCQFQTVDEIAAERKLSRNTVIRLFEDELGVEILHQQKRFKRRYRTIRIPTYVKDRVFARLTNK
jgi:AraC-like DNA-binding protein